MNAYDDGGEIVVDLVGYDDSSVIDAFYLHRLEEPESRIPEGTLRRYRLPLSGGSDRIAGEELSPTAIELPSLDYTRMNTRADHRYVYGVGLSGARGFYDQLVKIDTAERSTKIWSEEHCYPGEGVFAGRPGREHEDDGVVLSVVLDAARGTSFLLVLDAAEFTEIARAELPHPVLLGYHGQFYAEPAPGLTPGHVFPAQGS